MKSLSAMYFNFVLSIALAASAAATPIMKRQEDFAAGLLQRLNDTQATTLSLVMERLLTTDQGQELASALQDGEHTLLAPSDSAMDPAVLEEEPDDLAAIISYHILDGSFPASEVASPRTHTLAPTRLTDGDYVNLGGSPQVQVLEQAPDGNGVLVRQTTGNGTVTSSTTYENLIIHVVETVLTPPGDLKAALSSTLVGRAQGGFSQLGGSLQKVDLLEDWNDEASITVFAPIDDAFESIQSTVSGLSDDVLSSVLRNHILSDTLIYSAEFESTATAGAASGAQLDFSREDDILYVTHNETRARVLRSDVTTKNGVVHVIDTVLV